MRRGYTLFEILLVVALVAILAGMTVPAIESMYEGSRLQAGADQISGQWSAMRARAIIEGRPYRFSVQSGSGDFRVAPDDSAYWAGGDAPAGDNGGALMVQDSLPKGIRFATATSSDSSYFSNPGMNDGGNAPESGSGSWSTAAVFLPDGTAQQDVEITIRSADSGPISIRLRALTGTISTRWVPANEKP
jgi:prepilin-type N-terminal cleavage/methylation domain-containing protein